MPEIRKTAASILCFIPRITWTIIINIYYKTKSENKRIRGLQKYTCPVTRDGLKSLWVGQDQTPPERQVSHFFLWWLKKHVYRKIFQQCCLQRNVITMLTWIKNHENEAKTAVWNHTYWLDNATTASAQPPFQLKLLNTQLFTGLQETAWLLTITLQNKWHL